MQVTWFEYRRLKAYLDYRGAKSIWRCAVGKYAPRWALYIISLILLFFLYRTEFPIIAWMILGGLITWLFRDLETIYTAEKLWNFNREIMDWSKIEQFAREYEERRKR